MHLFEPRAGAPDAGFRNAGEDPSREADHPLTSLDVERGRMVSTDRDQRGLDRVAAAIMERARHAPSLSGGWIGQGTAWTSTDRRARINGGRHELERAPAFWS